jgi:hypothetical protein
MSLCRAVVCFASIFLGLASASAQVQGTVAPGQVQGTSVAPPLFQGIMVDAKGKTVGRIYEAGPMAGFNGVIRQIAGIWVALPVADYTSGFMSIPAGPQFTLYYQSNDCTGPAFMYVNPAGVTEPAFAIVTTIPPATAPAIYFAGTPSMVVNINSSNYYGSNSPSCNNLDQIGLGGPGSITAYMGAIQSVPVSSLGLTPPFRVK